MFDILNCFNESNKIKSPKIYFKNLNCGMLSEYHLFHEKNNDSLKCKSVIFISVIIVDFF